jgi:hypothetical protein
MRIFKNKWFIKFARKEGINNKTLVEAVENVEAGNIDANYGSGVLKLRIARPGAGKSGGYRTIILYLKGSRAFFVYGFSKKDRDNITKDEENYFKKLAKLTLGLSEEDLSTLLDEGVYEEIRNHA